MEPHRALRARAPTHSFLVRKDWRDLASAPAGQGCRPRRHAPPREELAAVPNRSHDAWAAVP